MSLECSALIAHDTTATIDEVRHPRRAADRKNVMIKIPATVEGFPAIEECIYKGIARGGSTLEKEKLERC